MRFIPKRDQIVGRIVDMRFTKGGLELPAQGVQVTVFLRVDEIGPAVKECKVGDLVLYKRCNHVFLRDGTHVVFTTDEDVMSIIETDEAEGARMVTLGDTEEMDYSTGVPQPRSAA